MIEIKTKNTTVKATLRLIVAVACLLFVFVLFSVNRAFATNSDIAKSYKSDQNLVAGNIVSLQPEQANSVERASSVTVGDEILGVVTESSQATISIDKDNGEYAVAIAGRAIADVNFENGDINRGDLISISSIDGIGTKARSGQKVVGVAEASIAEDDARGDTAKLPIIISVGVAPSFGSAQVNPSWIKNIAGNNVSAIQIAFVFFIAIVGLVSISFLTFSTVRYGVIATGRNPLAKPAIFNALSQSMIMVTIIAISSFSLIYFMLRL